MKTLTILLAAILLTCSAYAAAPTVTTMTASNATTSTIIIRGAVNANGSNTMAWFSWGTTSGLGSLTTAGSVTNGSTNYLVSATLSGLLAGTRYYYAVIASNTVSQISTGATENPVTVQLGYDFQGTGYEFIDVTRPFGSEPGSVWDDALRQTKAATKSFIEQEHTLQGFHKPGFIVGSYIQAGAISLTNLDASLQSLVQTNYAAFTNASVATLVTNALTYHYSLEARSNDVQTSTASLATSLLAQQISSNGFSRIMVTADVELINETGGNVTWPAVNLNLSTAGTVLSYGPFRVDQNSTLIVPMSYIFNGNGLANPIFQPIVTIAAQSDNSAAKTTVRAGVRNFRVWGIP